MFVDDIMEFNKYKKCLIKNTRKISQKILKSKMFKGKKISKAKFLLYAPSICLILAGSFAIFSPTMLKLFLSCFLIFSGILSLKVVKKIYATRNNILSILGQIDGQILIHKHHPVDNDDDMLFTSPYNNKKNMFH